MVPIIGIWSLAITATAAQAADIYTPLSATAETTQTDSGWSFSVTPYAWAASLEGETAQFGLPVVGLDWSFRDILDHLDSVAMVSAEARYDRFSLFGDVNYTKLSSDFGTPRGVLAGSVGVSTEMFVGMIGSGYAILDTPSGHVDVVAGIKTWNVETGIAFRGGVLDGISRTDDATWVDGLAGLRGSYNITPDVYLTGWGLVGAGGADLDWDVAGAIGYRINDTFSATAGYRAVGVDYERDGFLFDVTQQGPILALSINF
ncbi:MAG: hypothetical protein JNL61_10010 [Rhizobiaceae bacterium]|nr:hypothetical protein [Rhizobiaceae bacterium]